MKGKRLLSFILSLVLFFGSFNIVKTKAAETNNYVRIYLTNGSYVTLDSSNPFFVNGEAASSGTLGSNGCTAFYNESVGCLALSGYNGGRIEFNSDDSSSILQALGENKITASNASAAVYADGDLRVFSNTGGKLTVNASGTSSSHTMKAISASGIAGSENGNLTIDGTNFTLDVNVTSTDTYGTAAGLSANNNVYINGNASVDIYVNSRNENVLKGSGIYCGTSLISNDGIVINTTGDVTIDTSASAAFCLAAYNCNTYTTANTITNVGTFISHCKTDETYQTDARRAWKYDETAFADRRTIGETVTTRTIVSGTPHKVYVSYGRYGNYKLTYKYYAEYAEGEIATITAPELDSEVNFTNWTSEQTLNFQNGTSATDSTAQILVGTEDIMALANYDAARKQPSFSPYSGYISSTDGEDVVGTIDFEFADGYSSVTLLPVGQDIRLENYTVAYKNPTTETIFYDDAKNLGTQYQYLQEGEYYLAAYYPEDNVYFLSDSFTVAYDLPVLNATISKEGVISWNAIEGADMYVVDYDGNEMYGNRAVENGATSFDLGSYFSSNDFGDATYEIAVTARNSDNEVISTKWKGSYNYETTSTATVTATVGNKDVSGRVGDSLAHAVYVTLDGDTFVSELSGSWVTNLPDGISVTGITRTTDKIAKITMTGTPTETSSETIAITIPASQLTNSTSDVVVTENANAKFNIIEALPELQNVQVSEAGVISWDAFEGATKYSIIGGNSVYTVTGTSTDFYKVLVSKGVSSGNYTFKITAVNDDGAISRQYVGTYTYTKVAPKLAAPAEVWLDDSTVKWTAVGVSGVYYNLRVYCDNSVQVGYTVTGTQKELTLEKGHTYKFEVFAYKSGYTDSDKTMSESYYFTEDLAGSVAISGTAKYGETLTADTSGITNNTGTLSYQWKRGTENIGTNSATYTLTADDIGSTITVTVTSSIETDSLTSTATATVAKADGPAAPELTAESPSVKLATDGKITGVDTTMEYATSDSFGDAIACTGTEITNLDDGTYYVRVAETETHEAGSVAVVVIADGDPAVYSVEGSGQVYTLGSGETLEFTCEGEFDKFTGVNVNDELVDASNYTAVSGSTILTLSNAYLETLTAGEYSLQYIYTDGASEVITFTVEEAADTEEDADDTDTSDTEDVDDTDTSDDSTDVSTETTASDSSDNTLTANSTTSSDSKSPKTGDSVNLILIVILLAVSGGMLTREICEKKKED